MPAKSALSYHNAGVALPGELMVNKEIGEFACFIEEDMISNEYHDNISEFESAVYRSETNINTIYRTRPSIQKTVNDSSNIVSSAVDISDKNVDQLMIFVDAIMVDSSNQILISSFTGEVEVEVALLYMKEDASIGSVKVTHTLAELPYVVIKIDEPNTSLNINSIKYTVPDNYHIITKNIYIAM